MQDDAGTRGYYTKIRKSVLYQSCTNFVPICKKYRRDIKNKTYCGAIIHDRSFIFEPLKIFSTFFYRRYPIRPLSRESVSE